MSHNVVITGANGFMGQYVSEAFPQAKKIVREGSDDQDYISVGNITDKTDWTPFLKNGDVIIHLAGIAHKENISDEEYFVVNTQATIKLARDAIKMGVKRFIFMSSVIVLGKNGAIDNGFTEDAQYRAYNAYSESKKQAEIALLALAESHQIEIVIIRCPLVYGKGVKGNFLLLQKLSKKLPLLPFGMIHNARDFIYIKNLIHFIKMCVESPKAKNEIFHVSDNHAVSTKYLTNCIAESSKHKLLQLPVPFFLFNLVGKILKQEHRISQLVGDFRINIDKSNKLLGWKPPYTFEEGIKETFGEHK